MPASPRRFILFPRLVFTLLVAAAVSACGSDDGGGTSPPVIASVTVNPPVTVLTSLGATFQFSAQAFDASGDPISVAAGDFAWTSSAPAVASVAAGGMVEAIAAGQATIRAQPTGSSISGSSTVTVDQAAATIAVTLDQDSITAGRTAQATAAATDASGAPVAGSAPTWSSSDPAVATVDATGVVTGVSDGEALITATEDGATGQASLVVVRPDLAVGADTVWTGDVIVGDLSVPAGVTVTLATDIDVDVGGAAIIAGTLTGDCTALRVEGPGTARVSGTVSNVCVAQPAGGADAPGVTFELPAGMDFTDATVTSSGPITVRSLGPAQPFGPLTVSGNGAVRPVAQQQIPPGFIDLTRADFRQNPVTAPAAPDGTLTPPHGANVTLQGNLRIRLDRTTIQAQAGGAGSRRIETNSTDLFVVGGSGGNGGSVEILLPETGLLDLSTTNGPTTLIGADGGPGGPGSGTADPNGSLPRAPSVEAFGGNGGDGGGVRIQGTASLQGSLDGLLSQVGFGGRGGNATAIAADGVDATADQDAQPGGLADASAGQGGDAGSLIGGYVGQPLPDQRDGGRGGVAQATAGNGGDGIRERPAGAAGGDALATAGSSGTSWQTAGVPGGDAVADGGWGGAGADVCAASNDTGIFGQVAVLSDPAGSDDQMLDAGSGSGISLLLRIFFGDAGPGGPGGDGGALGARGGPGGFGQNTQAARGAGFLGPGGNGGDGGRGTPGGAGGAAGFDRVPALPNGLGDPIFQIGRSGSDCSSSLFGTPLAQSQGQPIAITGSAPWVDVNGTLAEDGSITATGRGTVAGVDDILVEFQGTWTAATKSLVGTYTIDSEKVIDANHPTIYSVNVQGNPTPPPAGGG